jgi:hypothetical protein
VGTFSLDIKTFLQKESKYIIALEIKALSKSIPTFDANLTAMLIPILEKIYKDSVAQIKISFKPSDDDIFQGLAQTYAKDRTADLVTNLEASTKAMLKSDLQQYMKDGLTPAEMAVKLQDNYAFSEARALTIARTETGFTWNHAAISTIKQGGAKGVKVSDGDYDPDCAEVDGQNWSFDYAEDHLLQHPNCVRSFGPMGDDEELDEE